MSVNDNEYCGILRTGDLELAKVPFELGVPKGKEELGMILVEDLVGYAGSIDTAKDLNVSTAIWSWDVGGGGSRRLRLVDHTGEMRRGHRIAGTRPCPCSHLGLRRQGQR